MPKVGSWHPQTVRGGITIVVHVKTYPLKNVNKTFNQFSHFFLPQTVQGLENFQRKGQNVPGAAGAAAGAAVGAAAVSAECLYYEVLQGRSAATWKYVIKYMQQTQQQILIHV